MEHLVSKEATIAQQKNWGIVGCKPQTIVILKKLLQHNIFPLFIVTLPHMPETETHQLRELAEKAQADFYILDTLDAISEQIAACDILLVCRYHLLPERIFNLPQLATLNVHSSLLPKYRGVHPVSWALINGEKETGVSVHYIDSGIDTGNILQQEICQIKDEHDIWRLTEDLNTLSAQCVWRIFQYWFANDRLPDATPQQGEGSYAPRRTPEDGRIHWQQQSARDIFNLTRALAAPYPAAYCFTQDKKKIAIMISQVVAVEQHKMSPGYVIKQITKTEAVKKMRILADPLPYFYLIECIQGVLCVGVDEPLAIGSQLQ